MFKIRYRSDIDGLRALSVLAVIAFHASLTGFNGGFVGVDIFFVISGYLITSLLCNELINTQNIKLSDFYANRIRRLFPAMGLLVATTSLVWFCFFLGIKEETQNFVSSVKYSLSGLANVYFASSTNSYFASASDQMPLLHLWSLAVEEQFYLFWPFLLLGAKNLKSESLIKRKVFQIILICTLISFAASTYCMHINTDYRNIAFYWMPLRAWELGIGGLLPFIVEKIKSSVSPTTEARLFEWFSLFGLLLIAYSVFVYSANNIFPGPHALFPVVGTALLLMGGTTQSPHSISKLLSYPLLTFLGKISYGWYLWHWPFLALGKVYYLGKLPPLEYRLGVVALSALIAWMSYTYFESPIRYSKKITALKASTTFISMLALCLLIFASVASASYYEARKAPTNVAATRFQKFEEAIREHRIQIEKLESCMGHPDLKTCRIKEGNGAETFIWGDSHGLSYVPFFERLSEKNDSALTLFSKGLTPPVLEVNNFLLGNPAQSSEVLSFNNIILQKLSASRLRNPQKTHIVVLASYWNFYLGKGFHLSKNRSEIDSLLMLNYSLSETLKSLQEIGISKVYLILPYPNFEFETAHCLKRNPGLCGRSRLDMDAEYKNVSMLFQSLTRKFPFVQTIDPLPVFCNKSRCPQLIENGNQVIPVVTDNNHPSKQAIIYLFEKVQRSLL